MTEGTRREADEQDEVLPKKGNVTEGSRGLQQWGDEAAPDGPTVGTGGMGTAERAARITRGQLDAERAKGKAVSAKERPEEG